VDLEFDNMDVDGSGIVSFEEFCMWCAAAPPPSPPTTQKHHQQSTSGRQLNTTSLFGPRVRQRPTWPRSWANFSLL
jgi:hypothetical protein